MSEEDEREADKIITSIVDNDTNIDDD